MGNIMTGAMTGALLLVGLVGVVGCRGPEAVRYERALEQTSAPAAHAIHDVRLSDLMQGLDRLRATPLPKPLDPHAEARQQTEELARVARAMARSAAQIPLAEPAGLDEPSRQDFLGLARRLERLCNELADDANRLTTDESWQKLAAIDATCDACHERFRIPRARRDDG